MGLRVRADEAGGDGTGVNFDPFGRNDFEDEQEVRDRHWHPQKDDIVLDVGAGIGSYTLPALEAGAFVTAFSPDQLMTLQLLTNLTMNTGFRERCRVVPCGLYSRAGWLNLENNARYVFADAPIPGVENLPVVTLDSLSLSRIDWIKVDVEGNELEVLRGAERSIRQHRPRMLVENHQFMDKGIEGRVIDFVEGLHLGYRWESYPHESVTHTFFEVPA